MSYLGNEVLATCSLAVGIQGIAASDAGLGATVVQAFDGRGGGPLPLDLLGWGAPAPPDPRLSVQAPQWVSLAHGEGKQARPFLKVVNVTPQMSTASFLAHVEFEGKSARP